MPETQRPLPDAAIAAIANGQKIEAIKIIRQEWNIGLKEAKDAVDDYVRTQPSLAGIYERRSAGGRPFVWVFLILIIALAIYYFGRPRP